MLQNEYLLAIVAVDQAENEPVKVWGYLFNLFSFLLKTDPSRRSAFVEEVPAVDDEVHLRNFMQF